MFTGIIWIHVAAISLNVLYDLISFIKSNIDLSRSFSPFQQDAARGPAGEEQGQSNVNVLCRICFFGENEGSERARRMLSCKTCGKKYHRNCLKSWAQHRGKIIGSRVYLGLHMSHILIGGIFKQISFIGVRGHAPLVEFVR